MRSRTSSLVFVFCLAAGAAFAACSGETTENPGGDGGSGASGSAGTTSSTTGASTTGASTSSTTASTSSGAGGDGGGGSDGGATVCDQACDKANECGFPVCDALPFDCADPAAECSARCVADATCEQLQSDTVDPELSGCLSECQGSEGGSAVECLSCSTRNGCMGACRDDSACQLWLLCALGCMRDDPQPECFSGCNADYAGTPTEEMIDAVYACTCTDCRESCDTVVDPCNQ
ncbi:hypothetical protein [Sorangium sp. So ce1000]|uniref:hypothetical protein n=1 Tax=Sorangium sp. So ce1000 TaxID=3133325 RepID=UPI003F626912